MFQIHNAFETEGYVPKTYDMLKKLGYIPTCPRCGYEFDE